MKGSDCSFRCIFYDSWEKLGNYDSWAGWLTELDRGCYMFCALLGIA